MTEELCGCEEGPVVIRIMATDANGTLLADVGYCRSCIESRAIKGALDSLEVALGDPSQWGK